LFMMYFYSDYAISKSLYTMRCIIGMTRKREVVRLRRLYVGNAFSVSMLSGDTIVEFKRISLEKARELVRNREFISFVGHPSTAEVMTKLLGVEVSANRVPVELDLGDEVLVMSLNQRLPEGKVLNREELEELVEQGKIQWWHIRVPEIQPII